jgi:hypothetical protein
MFWSNPKRETLKTLKKFNATILLITQSGKILFTSDELKGKPHDWFGGAVMEVMISHPFRDPFFIYYENFDYYEKMVNGRVSLAQREDFERYRSEVSIELCKFLILQVGEEYGIDIRNPDMHFSHNRIHTNVVAYVKRLGQWYPIQHGSTEGDSATERKVAMINSGEAEIGDFVALKSPSPE